MNQDARLIELRDKHGGLIFSFFITARPLPDRSEEGKRTPPEKGDEKPKNSESLMTDAQKRYLFRLLAEQGKEGEEAHEHLKDYFKVKTLREVTKFEASAAIEHFLAEPKGGEDDDRPPF